VIGVLVPDYLLTILVVIVTGRAQYLVLGIGFPIVRIVDAFICLRTIPQAFFGRSSGTWKSPERRSNTATNSGIAVGDVLPG
jgi:hypothetical protein